MTDNHDARITQALASINNYQSNLLDDILVRVQSFRLRSKMRSISAFEFSNPVEEALNQIMLDR